ncbi:MAG TPA: response regulator [Sphingomonas sp.]|nr:response regulator [Sphingomonas sp.]
MPRRTLVLLVEDDEIIREFVQTSLEDAGMGVVMADHGGDAIRLLDCPDDPVQVLVTDVRLGEGPDGWAVARYARKLRPDLAVVYFSGQSAADWPSEGVPKSAFLQKPFGPAQIIAAVQETLPSSLGSPSPNS